MLTDPIADFLTRVRNSVKAKHPKVDIPVSRVKISIAEIMKEHGFIKNYQLFKHEGKPVLRLYHKYVGKNVPVIHGLARVSRPSRRVYIPAKEIPSVRGGIGISIVSTSRGILADQVARENNVGGEVLCNIW